MVSFRALIFILLQILLTKTLRVLDYYGWCNFVSGLVQFALAVSRYSMRGGGMDRYISRHINTSVLRHHGGGK